MFQQNPCWKDSGFLVDRRIQILAQPRCMSSSRYIQQKRGNLMKQSTSSIQNRWVQQRLTVVLKLRRVFEGVFGCFAENHFRPRRVDQVFLNCIHWDQFTSQTLLEWCDSEIHDFHHLLRGAKKLKRSCRLQDLVFTRATELTSLCLVGDRMG